MATKSLGLTARDYSTLAAYAAYVNALSFAANEICEVYKDSGPVADTTEVTIGGYTHNGFTLTIRPASGQGFKDDAGAATNPLRWDSAKGAALTNSAGGGSGAYRFTGSNLIVDGLQVRANVDNYVLWTGTGTNQAIKNSIVHAYGGGGVTGLFISSNSPTIDNLTIICASLGQGILTQGSTSVITGCTVAKTGTASNTGISQSYGGAPVIKNTAVIGFTNDFVGTYGAASTNNATDKSSFGGTNAGGSGQVSITSADFGSLTGGSEDLRGASSSTKLINTGATAGLSTDIFGVARGATYDIGATEYAAPASTLSGSATLGDITASGTLSVSTSALSGSATLDDITAAGTLAQASGTITSPVLKNNTGTILASVTGIVANVYNPTTGALVVRKTGLSSSAGGIVTITDVLITAGVTYAYELDLSATSQGRRLPTGVAA
jgi:hypothetical protein